MHAASTTTSSRSNAPAANPSSCRTATIPTGSWRRWTGCCSPADWMSTRRSTEKPRTTRRTVARERDRFEIPLSRAAIAADLPVFAICRGVQVLNVAAGGSLVQDIPSAVNDGSQSLDRRAQRTTSPTRCGSHPGRRWRARSGRRRSSTTCDVNSRHHQAVGASRRRSSCPRCRRTAWWKRSNVLRRSSASGCNGIPKISGGRENSAGCSPRSSAAARVPTATQ